MTEKLDKNVIPWIDMINNYQGIETVSSCGGHKHPKDISQVPENEFYVSFRFTDGKFNSNGWSSISDLMTIITEYEFNDDQSLKIELNMTMYTEVFFTLKGKNVSFEDLYGEQ